MFRRDRRAGGAAFGAAGGGAGAEASGSLERGAGASSSVVSPPAVGGFQLAGEVVPGESMSLNAGERLPKSAVRSGIGYEKP